MWILWIFLANSLAGASLDYSYGGFYDFSWIVSATVWGSCHQETDVFIVVIFDIIHAYYNLQSTDNKMYYCNYSYNSLKKGVNTAPETSFVPVSDIGQFPTWLSSIYV